MLGQYSLSWPLIVVEVIYALEEVALHLRYLGRYKSDIVFLAVFGTPPRLVDF